MSLTGIIGVALLAGLWVVLGLAIPADPDPDLNVPHDPFHKRQVERESSSSGGGDDTPPLRR